AVRPDEGDDVGSGDVGPRDAGLLGAGEHIVDLLAYLPVSISIRWMSYGCRGPVDSSASTASVARSRSPRARPRMPSMPRAYRRRGSATARTLARMEIDELLTLERRGWDSLCDGTGGEFYGDLMTDDGVMVLAHGFALPRDAVVASLGDAPPWAGYEIRDP